jgi:hypothetical protein
LALEVLLAAVLVGTVISAHRLFAAGVGVNILPVERLLPAEVAAVTAVLVG